MPEKSEYAITLEMMGLAPASRPMTLVGENPEFEYKGYFGNEAFCGLHYYASETVRVWIATELPENPGTSITNRAEMVAETIENANRLQGVFLKGRTGPITYLYVEHYPRSKGRGDFDENFSVVRFSASERRGYTNLDNPIRYTSPEWTPLHRDEIERLIGQRFEGFDIE